MLALDPDGAAHRGVLAELGRRDRRALRDAPFEPVEQMLQCGKALLMGLDLLAQECFGRTR